VGAKIAHEVDAGAVVAIADIPRNDQLCAGFANILGISQDEGANWQAPENACGESPGASDLPEHPEAAEPLGRISMPAQALRADAESGDAESGIAPPYLTARIAGHQCGRSIIQP
jgi:hypothetical protein